MKFSERQGIVPVRTVLQTGAIDNGLRNRLWNTAQRCFYSSKFLEGYDYLPREMSIKGLFVQVWHNFLKRPTDTIGESYSGALGVLRKYFFNCTWYEVYEFIEFLTKCQGTYQGAERFIEECNQVLKEEMAGYRFVSGRIVPITSEEEVSTIEAAMGQPDPLRAVTTHLGQALAHLADRKSPDYRNSIKESISAIESLSKLLSGLPGATLGPALDAVEEMVKLHPSLKDAFKKLYGYASDAQGIRHALLDEPTLDFEDAKFMLVSCSAFVNYMVVKAQKADIKV